MPHRPLDQLRVRLVPGPTTPRVARTAVWRALAGADPDVIERAMLLTSELVTNGVVHAATPLVLTLRVDNSVLHVEVEDGDRTPARPVPEEQSGPQGGFGLHIVERLASAWGCARRGDGKVVWFEMPLHFAAGDVGARAGARQQALSARGR